MYYVGICLCPLKSTMSQTYVSAREQIVKDIKKSKNLRKKKYIYVVVGMNIFIAMS